MIDPSLRNRRRAGTSQLPMELLLTAYAVVAAIILLRTLLRLRPCLISSCPLRLLSSCLFFFVRLTAG